ncbi:hypothetical protein F4778DRAFT_471367 [Xylariomycetidae sp. FL2044]|nr:hypothetical protein F4778DRAFT_471367 [Xylariomycetidae sp. FL2044]
MSTDTLLPGYINAKDLPQDPYLPQEDSYGPSFLDTNACLCSLRQPTKDGTVAWQCIGNQTDPTNGKWYNSLHGGNNVDLPIEDASNPPDTGKTLRWNAGSQTLIDMDQNHLNDLTPFDKACTGINQTTMSTSFYRAFAANEAGTTPYDAAPCWRPSAIPLTIQNVTSWESKGCGEGFLCQNNTVNSLPQFCPPLTACQYLRVAGKVCEMNGTNFGMGPFEPVICREGWYCPLESKGKETIKCPKGSYCQVGASTPTPCNVGSHCPEGSAYQVYLLPLAILIIVDVLIAFAVVWMKIRKRFQNRRRDHAARQSKRKTVGGFGGRTGYKELVDEADNEMLNMQATYAPRSDTWTGFEAALEMPNPQPMQAGYLEDDSNLSPQLRVFVESMRKATDAERFGLSFAYANLSFHPKSSPRPILQNVTGSIERGRLTAVMGGSGGGKSTFINVLMGKTINTGGSVMINNVPGKIKKYKRLIGYVPQDDIVLPELTVYENILHSARVRLPRNWADVDIKAHVNSVIECLELSHVRDSLVGSVGKPVISGGQRKRVSIGMELAAAPMAIFLDEPTSGLDATAASSIMRTLKAIARLGISVIVIIHQPRMEIFDMIDDLILLGNGQIIYEGPESSVQGFFENIGFHFPEHSNNGDVVTDIITGNGRDYKRSGDISKEALISHWANSRQHALLKSRHESIQSSRASIVENQSQNRELLRRRGARRVTQAWLCLRRAMLQQWRGKSALWFELGLASIAGALLGLAQNSRHGRLYVGVYREPYDVLSVASDNISVPQFALLTCIAIGLVAGAPGVKVFSEEMLLHRREAEAGHSRVAYFIAKNISVIPRMVLGCLHFTTLLLLLAVPIVGWGLAFFANLIYFYCIYGLASIVSMVARREDAPLIATMIALIAGILSGAAPPLSSVKDWHMEWLWRASPGTWLAEMYFGQLVEPFRYLYNVDLTARVTGFHLDWLGRNLIALFAIGTIYRIFAYAGLFFGRLRI